MKRFKTGNLAKAVAFFLIVTVLTCVVAFAAGDWQNQSDKPDSGKVEDNLNDNGNSAENSDGSTNGDEGTPENIPTDKPLPEYLHYITGLEASMEDYYSLPLCFLMEASGPIYGIGASYLTLEIPTDFGSTRMLCFMDKSALPGKIGSVAPTRAYISDIAGYFGGILFSCGSDDKFEYGHGVGADASIDFSVSTGYNYTEFNAYSYTNSDLVSAALKNTETGTLREGVYPLPYRLCEYGERASGLKSTAKTVAISYRDGNTTELYYSAEDGKYQLYKNGSEVRDLISNKSVFYDNAFVLYATATTYEAECGAETVLDMTEGGRGIYCTEGKSVDIRWTIDQNGEIIFTDEGGEILTVNRGSSYVSFVKASIGDGVSVS